MTLEGSNCLERCFADLFRLYKMASPIVQYVVVRSDLLRVLNWPIGAVIAQACHACTAVLHRFQEDQYVRRYTDQLTSMHKIVVEVSLIRAFSKEVCLIVPE